MDGQPLDAAPVEAPPAQAPPAGRRRRRLRGPWLVSAALVVVLLVGAGLYLSRGEPLTSGGRYVRDPGAVLAAADEQLTGYVEQRNGVAGPDSRCWFELAAADGVEVRDALLCGPVLFVDGDPGRAWLRFPLTATADGGDVRLSVAALPADPAPDRPADPGLLHRPDGGRPPAGSGGLAVPAPPPAEPGWTATGPFPGVPWSAPAGPARLSGPAAAVTVTGLAAPERVGTGDDARRAADGERLLAVRYEVASGEGRSATPPSLSYVVDGADPVPVAPGLVAPGSTVEVVLSVPADTAAADLVVDDAGVQQRLSLLTGAPGSGNLAVLARTNRTAEVDASRRLDGTLSAPGRVPAELPFTVAVTRGTLTWWAGPDGASRPADPSRALLVLDASLALPGTAPGGIPADLLSLRLPDGTVLRALDLADDPDRVLLAFDVPADLTAAVLRVGGSATFPDGAVVDLGTGRLDVPIAVPAG
ncbi:hypothetical protein [Modestobacter versicolor]|uniref:hypothetical protein n=1 Tax=Modestobacter versicolor TaxID=429133 RepID=UPI0034E02247